MIKLSIIILSYNTQGLTLKCLESIMDQYRKELETGFFDVIIFDNASSDNTVDIIKEKIKNLKNVCIIPNKENLGFSKGNNLAVDKSKSEYVVFLNSDTEVLDQGLVRMVEFLDQNKKVGILGGKLKNPDGTSQKSAGVFYNLPNIFLMLVGLERFGFLRCSPGKVAQVDWVSGACLMIGRDLFNQLNGFNEKLFMYFEDLDICFKAKLKGFTSYFYPLTNILHKERGSSNRAFAIQNIYKGISYFYKEHKPYWQYLILIFLLKLKAAVLILVCVILNKEY